MEILIKKLFAKIWGLQENQQEVMQYPEIAIREAYPPLTL